MPIVPESGSADGLEEKIVEFCRLARMRGFSAGVKESLAAVQVAGMAGIADREVFKYALRAVMCASREDWELFDPLFESFWKVQRPQTDSAFPNTRRNESSKPRTEYKSSENRTADLLGSTGEEQPATEDGGRATSGASAFERLKQTDFSEVRGHDQTILEQLAARLLRQMSLRLSRRLEMVRNDGRLDLRKTIRRSISRGGEPVDLIHRWKKLQPSRLVVFLDISGSMNPYSLFLVRFAFALQKHFRRVDTFVFSTRLVDITKTLKTRDLPAALCALSQQAAGWSGGTKIGESLAEFNRLHGRRLSRDTLFIILSDGWETGEPELLSRQMEQIRLRVRKLIWLNPLLGLADYQPITRGMSAALPYIDVFAPGHNLASLLALEKHLSRGR